MTIPIWRNFLYVDKQMVEEFLTDFEGMYEDKIVETKEHTKGITGEGKAVVFGGGVKSEDKESTQVTKQALMTDAAKFQRLYYKLEQQGGLTVVEIMGRDLWNNLKRGQILEIAVNGTFSKYNEMSDAFNSLSTLTKAYELFTGEKLIDEKKKEGMEVTLGSINEIENKNGLPFIMTIPYSNEYKFLAYLNPDNFKLNKSQWSGELNIFCKVQRKFEKGEKVELFNLDEIADKFPQNRAQRRKLPKSKMPNEVANTVKGPGAILLPIAIYR